jgi:hypothetical protein
MTTKTRSTKAPTAPRGSKKAQLIRILSAKAGADVARISETLGWQSHTTRAAISGLKKAGYEVATEKPEGGKSTRYRITAMPKPTDGPATAEAARVPAASEVASAG